MGNHYLEIIQEKTNYCFQVSFSAIADILEDIVGSVGDISKDVPKAAESLAILMAKLVEHNLCTLNILNMLASKHSSDAQLVK